MKYMKKNKVTIMCHEPILQKKIIMYVSESIYKIYTLFLGTEKKLERVAFGKKQLWPWLFQLSMIVSIWKSCAWINFIIQNKNAQKCNINHVFA